MIAAGTNNAPQHMVLWLRGVAGCDQSLPEKITTDNQLNCSGGNNALPSTFAENGKASHFGPR